MDSRPPSPTALKESQWQMPAPLLPAATAAGRPAASPQRDIVHAILAVLRTGGAGATPRGGGAARGARAPAAMRPGAGPAAAWQAAPAHPAPRFATRNASP